GMLEAAPAAGSWEQLATLISSLTECDSLDSALGIVASAARSIVGPPNTIARVVWRTGPAEQIGVVSPADARLPTSPATEPHTERRFLQVPLMSRLGASLGSIELYRDGGADFADNDRHVLAVLAGFTSLTLERTSLADARDRLVAATSKMPDAMVVLTAMREADGRIYDFEVALANDAAETLMRRPLQSRRLSHALPSVGDTGVLERYRRTIDSKEPRYFEVRYDQEGLDGWYRCTEVPHNDDLVVVFRDVTVAKEAEDALRATNARLERVHQAAGIGGWEYDVEARTMTGTSELFRLLGVDPHTLDGRVESFTDYLVPEDLEEVVNLVQRTINTGEPFVRNYRLVRPDGSAFIGRAEGRLVTVPGESARLVGTIRDVTNEQHFSDHVVRVLRGQRLESVALLAGGIAHNFNNLLAVIVGHAELLEATITDDESHHASAILVAASRAMRLTTQLLSLSEDQAVRSRHVDLRSLLESFEGLLVAEAGPTVAVVFDYPTLDSLMVEIDPVQLEHVVVNLVQNAADAMPDGGTVKVTLGEVVIDGAQASDMGIGQGRYACLTVADTGRGMSPQVLEHAADPFFTTKRPGEGTGLSLTTADRTVRRSGGHLLLNSEPGEGTTARVYLPIAPTQHVPERAGEGGSETILLAEDDATVRALMVEVLAQAGYHVIEVGTARDALERALDPSEPIDLLVSDVVMPEVAGPELAQLLVAIHQRAAVLFVSGYAGDHLQPTHLAGKQQMFLAKPFSVEDLLTNVRRALDSRPSLSSTER
ncbi:MAG: histidine kinase, partial [Acidimicrobiia bacterium]|nr:histidine kinase [Acidimicrobiia bacterium]